MAFGLETVTVYSFKCGFMDVKSLEVKCKSGSNGDTSDDLVLFSSTTNVKKL